MQAVVYYLSLPLIYLISVLPFGVLYLISDLMYSVVYHLVGYRKKIVRINLKNSFPNYTESELRKLEKESYRYFCDLIVESIKNLTISKSELRKHLVFDSLEPFEKHFKANQSIVVLMGHVGNWELAGSRIALENFHKMRVIYQPQKNQYVDSLTVKMRTRFGNDLVPMNSVLRQMLKDKDELTSTVFIADQNPSKRHLRKLTFLNQTTLVFDSAEKIAKKLGYPVIYAELNRTSRGFYTIKLNELCDAESVEDQDVTQLFFEQLEESIRKTPATWLWTHKRWKFTNDGEYNR